MASKRHIHATTGWEAVYTASASVTLTITNSQSPPSYYAFSSGTPTDATPRHPFPNFLQTGPLSIEMNSGEKMWVYAEIGTTTEITEG